MASTEQSEVITEWQLKPVGRGSFATVYVLTGRPVAFKTVLSKDRTPELKREFNMFIALYDFCNTDSTFFIIPRPLAYLNPSESQSYFAPPSTPDNGQRRNRRPFVSAVDFEALSLDSAAYAMEQVLPLPLSTAAVVRNLFYPPHSNHAPNPTLCRLYFGKVFQSVCSAGRPVRFFNSSNFPLDRARYKLLTDTSKAVDYPSRDEITCGMGEMLGRLHWGAGYDGRDIEFIMGGMSFSGVSMQVIDFNQMRPWTREKIEINLLVDSFFQNDPYYPRPRTTDPLYQQFCKGYTSAYSEDGQELALAVLQAFQQEQAQRDLRQSENCTSQSQEKKDASFS